ncbi:NADAR family protein [bacterium SCSIO 12741]|nr:NADAR family protein [bacterium SCSIO 12741]
MKYSIEKLLTMNGQLNSSEFLFFWGHQPKKDGTIGSGCLSQWWMSAFEFQGMHFATAEHWMMYKKAELFKDAQMAEEILQCESPAKVKKLGRKVQNFDPHLWNKKKFEFVVEGNRHKFFQNRELADFLISTGDKIIVEASPYDRIWGIGMSKNHSDIESPDKWRGQNLLGFALMEVRDWLKSN